MCQIFLLILSGFICSAMRITTSVTWRSEGGYSKGRRNLICLLPLFLEVCILKTSGSPCVAIYKSLHRTFVSSSSLFTQSANRMTTESIFWKVTKKAIIWVESSGNWHSIYTSDPLLRASCRIAWCKRGHPKGGSHLGMVHCAVGTYLSQHTSLNKPSAGGEFSKPQCRWVCLTATNCYFIPQWISTSDSHWQLN